MSTAPKSEILNFVDMVGYQEGSVVSRQITKSDGGNVTLFAFDAGQELSEHTAPFDALVHIVEGQAEIIISGKSFHLKSGQAIVMPANEPHALKATEQFKMLLTMIKT
ncbi:MAG: cupin domain-containing protein [Anaerolineales bacterium]